MVITNHLQVLEESSKYLGNTQIDPTRAKSSRLLVREETLYSFFCDFSHSEFMRSDIQFHVDPHWEMGIFRKFRLVKKHKPLD